MLATLGIAFTAGRPAGSDSTPVPDVLTRDRGFSAHGTLGRCPASAACGETGTLPACATGILVVANCHCGTYRTIRRLRVMRTASEQPILHSEGGE